MLYDTRALTESEWAQERSGLFADDWEYQPPILGVVYVRKHLSGLKNTDSKGWLTKPKPVMEWVTSTRPHGVYRHILVPCAVLQEKR